MNYVALTTQSILNSIDGTLMYIRPDSIDLIRKDVDGTLIQVNGMCYVVKESISDVLDAITRPEKIY